MNGRTFSPKIFSSEERATTTTTAVDAVKQSKDEQTKRNYANQPPNIPQMIVRRRE